MTRWVRIGQGAGVVAALALLAESLRASGVEQIVDSVARVGWGLAGILLLSGARDAVRAFAWTRAVDGPARLRFLPALRARLAGEALNTLLPMGMVVGEPTKALHVGREVAFGPAATALAVEFAFYTASLVALFAAGLAAIVFASGVTAAGAAIVSLAIATLAVGALVIRRARRTIDVGRPFQGRRGGAESPALQVLRLPATAIIACETAYQLLSIAETYYTLRLNLHY